MKTVTDGDGLFAPMFNSLASLWLAGTAVLSGCTLTGSGSALQITVGAGTATATGASVTVAGGTAAVTANAGTVTRYDLLYANGSGALGIALGGTSTPALPVGCIPLAVLEIGPGQTTVPADRIHDCRALASLVVAAAATITAVGAVTLHAEQIYTAYTVAASANPLVTFPDKAVAAAEGLVRIVHFVIGPACVGAANTLRVSGYVASGGGYLSAIQVKHNTVAVLDDSSVKDEAFTVDLAAVEAGDVIEVFMSTISSTNTGTSLMLAGDATILVYPDMGTTL